jgi:integrase
MLLRGIGGSPGTAYSRSGLDDGSYRVVARVGTKAHGTERRKEQRFPRGTGLRAMTTWQENQRADIRRDAFRPARATLAADVERYVRIMRQRLVSPESREYETGAWLTRFGHRRRDSIEREEVRQQMLDWEAEGMAASTIRHRLTALSQLYMTLDGEDAHNPVRGVKRPREPKATPDGKSPTTVQAVLAALEDRTKRNNRGWKTLARAKVIALTGMRHSQVMRLEQDHIFLADENPYVVVVDAGKDGEPHDQAAHP